MSLLTQMMATDLGERRLGLHTSPVCQPIMASRRPASFRRVDVFPGRGDPAGLFESVQDRIDAPALIAGLLDDLQAVDAWPIADHPQDHSGGQCQSWLLHERHATIVEKKVTT